MNQQLKIGTKHKSTQIVTNDMTAIQVGSGDLPVLATPAMIALMENAAMLAVAEKLAENETTVGGFMECSHLRPTGVGAKVDAEAVLNKIDGKALHFDIVAFEGEKRVGEGHHIRYIVDRKRFLLKL